MKQLFKSLVLVASVAASLISCQKEQNSPEVKEAFKLTVHAKAENLSGDTKTYISGKQVLWGTGEYMTAALVSGEDLATYNSNSTSADLWDGESQAMFEFDVELSAGPVTYGGIYPSSAVVPDNNKNATSFKVNLSAMQSATAASYDPSAYIMIAKPETFTVATKEWEASFRRTTALNKITLTGLEDNITSVKITVPEGKYLAGRRYMNLTTGDKGEVYSGGGRTNALTINYTSPLASDVESKDIWFTSWGVEIPEGAKMTVVAYSDDYSYTREITAKADGIKFTEGFLNTLSINMASAEKEPLEKLEGDYAVLVAQNDVYYILSSTNTISSTRLDAVEFTGYKADTEYTPETPLQIVDPNFVWTISLDENSNYTLKNGSNYLSYSGSDNSAKVDSEPYALTIVKEDGGKYNISSASISGRRLAKNTGSKYFAFYGGNQEKELILVPAEYVKKTNAPEINYEKTTSTVTISAEEGASIYYTTDGTNPTESSTKVEYTEPFTLAQTATVKAYATLEGCLDSDVASKECVVGQNTPKYVKVTAKKDDWSGTYLIVSGTTAFTGTISTTSKKYGQITTVTVSNDAIESTTTIDGYKVVVEKSGDNYTIKTKSSGYLYWTSDNTLNANDNLQSDSKSLWNFTFNEGGTVSITNVNTNTRVIRFNSDRFACYTTATGSIPNLYELEDNRTSQTLTFTNEEGTIDLNGNVQNLPTLSTDGAFTTITYSSDDESVATVDPNAGTVTAIKVGTAKITATAAESSTYKKATASYNLTVVDTTPIINASNPAAVEADATSVEVPYTVTNSVVGKSLSVTIPEDASWITSSNVTDSKVTLTITQNAESSQRSAVITLSYEGAISKEVTVKQSGAPATAYTSLAELYAAGLTSGTTVTAILTNEVITEVVTKGLCFDAGGNKVEIYGNAAFPTEWGDVKVGGYISGTVTCTWSYYEKGSIWELMPTGWSAFTYKAPCATPKITLDGANATITCTTTGATILYEIADSKPANFTNTYNGSPIALSDGQTIWAKATLAGYPDSDVASKKYTAGGGTDPKEYTYTFSSKSWGDATSSWTSGKDGNGYTANQGVQVTSGVTGANATSKSSFTNVSKIVVNYCTNVSKGKGTISVKVGNGTAKSYSVSAPSSGGTTLRNTDDFVFSTHESGTVNITVECSTNSIYINSITITAE